MNIVLGYLIAIGEASQKELVNWLHTRLQAEFGVTPRGTACAYVSASLLHFAEAGWVESAERDCERSPIWRVIG